MFCSLWNKQQGLWLHSDLINFRCVAMDIVSCENWIMHLQLFHFCQNLSVACLYITDTISSYFVVVFVELI